MKYIRDGIYGYIAVSPIEDAILNHPSVLRLHKILQNSTLYHTYPFNRSSRFPHSIGTMHVAGKLLDALFLNSAPSDVQKIVEAITRFISQLGFKEFEIEKANTYVFRSQTGLDASNPSTLFGGEYYAKSRWKVEEKATTQSRPRTFAPAFVHTILSQAVRLAAIVHDIGHLPYSHVIEFALEELENRSINYDSSFAFQMRKLENAYKDIIQTYTRSKAEFWGPVGKLHERIGLVLIDGIYNEEKYNKLKGEDVQKFFDLSFAVCVMLIAVDQYGHYSKEHFHSALEENKDFGYLYPLANIISGPVDCDRLDYLLRDSVNSGAPDFASFDQERIINHVVLARVNLDTKVKRETEIDHSSGREVLIPAFDRRAFSALSDFFYSRHRQFRWILSHHNVVRTDLALSRLIFMLAATVQNYDKEKDIFPSGMVDEKLKSILEEIGFPKLLYLENLSKTYRYVDDSWLDTVLQDLLRRLADASANKHDIESEHRKYNNTTHNAGQSQTIQTVRKYLELIIERRTDSLRAIWKNEDRFRYFAEGFTSCISKIDSAQIEKLFSVPLKDTLMLVRRGDLAHERRTNLLLKAWWDSQSRPTPFTVMLPIEQDLNKGDKLIHFVLKVFNPYDGVNVVLEDGRMLPLEKMSSVVAKLKDIVFEGLMLYAYDGSTHLTDWKDDTAVRQLGEEVGRILFGRLAELDSIYKGPITEHKK